MEKEVREQIIKMYSEGKTAKELSRIFPYHNSTISRLVKEAGVSRGRLSAKRLDIEKSVVEDFLTNEFYCEDLAKKYEVDVHTIYRILDKFNIERKTGYKSNCNEDYFEAIDNPHKAYLLGFITADGAVVKDILSIEVHQKDIDLINFAREQINPKATITQCNYGKKNNVRISLSAKKLGKDLFKYGIVQNKSKIIKRVPVELIPKDLLPYYFRGLIDGDGCVHLDGKVSIYSGSEDFIKDVQDILCKEIDLPKLKIYHGTTYFIAWGSKDAKQKIFDYLYSNLDETFYYKRKYERLKAQVDTEVSN
jgi:hypothetical protein